MATIVGPQTYYATTKSGKQISEVAQDANTIIDYPSIEAACDDALKIAEEGMEDISKSINKVEIGSEALSVADKNMEGTIEEVGIFIKKLPNQYISPTLEEAKKKALTEHNKKQEEFNKAAQDKINQRAQTE